MQFKDCIKQQKDIARALIFTADLTRPLEPSDFNSPEYQWMPKVDKQKLFALALQKVEQQFSALEQLTKGASQAKQNEQ